MKEIFRPVLDETNIYNYALHEMMDEDVEVNLSDELDVVLKSITLGVHDESKEHLMIHPDFRSKIIEAMIENPLVEAELVTEADGHKLRGKKRHIKTILRHAIEKMGEQ